MTRWEPNGRERLEEAALELYLERGFEQTTVAEIAERAGLTERTFFRHFADKREVLFGGSSLLQDAMVAAVAAAPTDAAPMDAVGAALDAAAEILQARRDRARQRQKVIDANVALQERELIKMAALAAAVATALRERGIDDPAASLAAETGIGVFKIAFARWIGNRARGQLADVMRDTLAELRTVTART